MKRSLQRLSTAARRQREQGVALLTALILMLAVLMTGIASTRSAMQNARAAAHERDRMLALQMADAALFDAERDIEGDRPGRDHIDRHSGMGLAKLHDRALAELPFDLAHRQL